MTVEEFSAIVEEEIALLPEYVFEELNGGVLVDERALQHPDSQRNDLYILGTYTAGGIPGKQVTLYYGSFMAAIPGALPDQIRAGVRDTLRHEFLHHLETKAGMFGEGSLVEEDRESLIRYLSV